MSKDITLSASANSNLLSLQQTTGLMDRTSLRLNSGKKVQSAADDAVAFFQSKGLNDRASVLAERKDTMVQGIQTLDAAIKGLEGVEEVLRQMKAKVVSAKSATDSKRAELMESYNELAVQMNKLVTDTTYQGLNLIGGTSASLRVQFSDLDEAYLNVNAVDVNASALMTAGGAASVQGSAMVGVAWSAISAEVTRLRALENTLDSVINTVQGIAERLGGNIALLTARKDFTEAYKTVLENGSSALVNIDANEESVNMVALQTRQQLGIQSLSATTQAEQSVLSLFR